VLDEAGRAELATLEAEYHGNIRDAYAAHGRADELIRSGRILRPFEPLEAELETELQQLIEYCTGKFKKKLRWLLESWKDTPEE
jgi:hypothetical protein